MQIRYYFTCVWLSIKRKKSLKQKFFLSQNGLKTCFKLKKIGQTSKFANFRFGKKVEIFSDQFRQLFLLKIVIENSRNFFYEKLFHTFLSLVVRNHLQKTVFDFGLTWKTSSIFKTPTEWRKNHVFCLKMLYLCMGNVLNKNHFVTL